MEVGEGEMRGCADESDRRRLGGERVREGERVEVESRRAEVE